MTPEARVNQEIAAALMQHRLCVLPDPKDISKLPCSPWSLPDLAHHVGIVWRENTGMAAYESGGRGRRVRFGIPGKTDWCGWLFPNGSTLYPNGGRRLQIEAKSLSGSLSLHQEANRVLCLNTGVLWGLVRSYDECCALLESWGLRRPV